MMIRLALQVLDALGESVPCASYDSWMVHVPEGQFESRIGPTDFLKVQFTFSTYALSYFAVKCSDTYCYYLLWLVDRLKCANKHDL
jgi:hypothetical protein